MRVQQKIEKLGYCLTFCTSGTIIAQKQGKIFFGKSKTEVLKKIKAKV